MHADKHMEKKNKILHVAIFTIVALIITVSFQNCGNVSVSQSKAKLATDAPPSDLRADAPPPTLEPQKAKTGCVREASALTNLIDLQIPTGKILYNNYFTKFLALGDELLVLANYSYGDPLVQNGPVTGATGVVDAKFISDSGTVTPIALPNISGYTWNSQAGTAPSWCYIEDAKSNYADTAYLMIYCSNSSGVKSFIYSINKTSKVFTQIVASDRLMSGLTLNKQKEPMYYSDAYDSAKGQLTYQIYKYSGGAASALGPAFGSDKIAGYSLWPTLIETQAGEILVYLNKNSDNTKAFYQPATNQITKLTWSRETREILQFFDDRELFYYSFDYGAGVNNSLFKINQASFTEAKMSDDNRYIYSYQTQLNKVITKVGSDYGSGIGKAWISYDQGQNFSEVVSAPMQTNQILQTLNDKFYLIGVNNFSGGHIKASVYKLICQN